MSHHRRSNHKITRKMKMIDGIEVVALLTLTTNVKPEL